jgi:hypothetical protein
MTAEFEQVSRSLEEAEAALSFGNFSELHDLLQQASRSLDAALLRIRESEVRIEELHGLQQSFEEPPPFPIQEEEEIEEELLVVA